MITLRPFSRALRLSVVAAALTAGSACYHAQSSRDPTPATVRVENQSFYDYNLYVTIDQGQSVRLGFVRSKSTVRFTLPDYVLMGSERSLQFQARPVGTQGGPVSEEVLVAPGEEVGLEIPPS